jgi:hypothetical protein
MRFTIFGAFTIMLTVFMFVAVGQTGANHSGDLNCGDFPNQKAAQDHMNAHPGDPDNLDGNDNDGKACESLSCPCYTGGPTPPITPVNPTPPNPTAPNPTAPNPTAPNPTAPNPTAPNPTAPNPTATAPNPTAPNPTVTAPSVTPPNPTSPAPTVTVTPVSTPTSTPEDGPLWGDTDCDGQISTRDNQALLRKVLQQSPLSHTDPCPGLGSAVGDYTWGDWDCDSDVSTRDNQALLRIVLQQAPLSHADPCPDLGDAT